MTHNDPPLDLTIRCGLDFIYEATAPTPIVFLIKPRLDRWQHIEREQFTFEPHFPLEEHEDVGHQVYPLIDTETSTEPVPVYTGSRPPVPAKEARGRLTLLAVLAVAAALLWYLTRNG